ncbi:MAG: DUF192 domain-containing protein [Acidimicrobiia bacterium]|nr:DUF192 domain-containing protein [Acidimicrobiia bacterium]
MPAGARRRRARRADPGPQGVDDLGAHDGMVFVFDGPTRAAFTMGGTPMELDVAFYDDDGRLVARHRMAPCEGDGAGCPTYSAGAPFRYALEVPAGRLPGGSLVFTPGS